MATPLHLLSPVEKDDTQMGFAMRNAGIKLPGEKLSDMAMEACRTYPGKRGAQRKHINDQLNGELTYTLMMQWRPTLVGEAIGVLLDKAQTQINLLDAQDPKQRAAAAVITASVERIGPKAFPTDQEPIEFPAPSPVVSWDRDGKFAANDEARRARIARSLERTAVKLSKLDDFLVNGRPIGDATVDEADSWAAKREQDARFVRLLTAGLPRGTDKPIREFRTNEESDTLFVEAEKMRVRH